MPTIPKTPTYVLLGGSFNPPHVGHLAMAQAVHERLHQAGVAHTIALMPSHNPFKPIYSTKIRAQLVQSALDAHNDAHHTYFVLETHELNQNNHTYTIDTLQALHARHARLVFVVGQDSFAAIPSWKGGFALLQYCHLWVFGRAGVAVLPDIATTHTVQDLWTDTQGKIYIDDTPIVDISSTTIRQKIYALWQQNASFAQFVDVLGVFLSVPVIRLIFLHKLYAN